MENVPVLGSSVCYMAVHVLFAKLNYFQSTQLIYYLLSCEKGHPISWSIPFIMHPEELTCKNLVETLFRSKWESKVGIHQVVCLKLKSFKRRFHNPQVILGKACQQRD